MSPQVERLPDEPIIVIMFDGAINGETAQNAIKQVAQMAEGMPKPIFRVIDTRNTTSSFSDIVMILAATTKGADGSASDQRFRSIMVGTHDMIVLLNESLKQPQYGEIDVPLFEDMDEALAYARQALAEV